MQPLCTFYYTDSIAFSLLSTITQRRYTDRHKENTTSLYFLMISVFRMIFHLDTLVRVVNDQIQRHFLDMLSCNDT